MPIEEKQEAEKKIEEKKEEKVPFWKNLSPTMILIAGVVIFLLFMSMGKAEDKSMYIWMIFLIIIVLWLIAQTRVPESKILSPREAELYTERDLLRKQVWGQVPIMSKFKIGPVLDMFHRDGRGKYYNVAVTRYDPYTIPKYYISKVMAIGEEKGFVTLVDSVGLFNGQVPQEVDAVHMAPWVKVAGRTPFLEKLWGLGRGGHI